MKISGIYIIENIKNNKKYIGSSTDCDHRWYIHRWHLINNHHPNQHLQNAWNEYGEECFLFSIVEIVEEMNLLEKEKTYIEQYDCLNEKNGYNICADPSAPMKGRKHSQESKKNMSRIKKGSNNSFFGKHHSEETKKKLRDKMLGRKLSEEHKKKISKIIKSGEQNINAKLTLEKVRKIREEFKDNKEPSIIKKLALKYDVNYSTINKIVKNLSWKEEAQIEN